MPLMDEFKEERAEVKNRTPKEQLAYFWDYYKWHVIGGAIGLAVAISLIHTLLTHKETAFYVALVNISESLTSEDYVNSFAEKAGIDQKKYQVYFDANLHLDLATMDEATVSTTQKIMVYISAGDMDAMISDTTGTERYAYNGVMMDLRDFLSPEECEKYEPYFYYLDRTLLQEAESSTTDPDYPDDPSDPSTMEDPIPVAIRVNECAKLSENYFYSGPVYFSVIANSSHLDYVHLLLDDLWGNN